MHMRDIRYLATPHLQGACVTVSDQVHGLFRLKGARKAAEPARIPEGREDLPAGGMEHVLAFADATARLAQRSAAAAR